MAKRFLTPINVLNAASDPVTAAEGDLYYNTSTDKLKIYSNSAWVDVSSGGGGVTSLTGTANEIDVSASTGAITISLPTTINANTTGSAASLTTARAIALSGDVSGSANFDGSASAGITTTLANTAVTPASYGSASAVGTFTVDSKGRLTAASNTAIAIAQSAVTNLTTDLAAKAPLASPALTGTPTAPTAAVDTNTTQIATTAYVIGQGYLKSSTASSTYAALSGATFTGSIITPAATTSITSIRLPHGTAPTSPTNGDIWTTTAGVYARVNGATVGPFAAANAGINVDGGTPTTNYGGINPIDGGGVT